MNIYADTGKIITGKRYVSRPKIEKEIIDRTMGEVYGSVSVVGMQRMGKSSVMAHLYNQYYESCFERSIIMLSLSLNEFNSLAHFYKTIGEMMIEALEDHDLDIPSRIERVANKLEQADDDRAYNQLTRLIRNVKKMLGYRLYIILDEFDRSRKMFKNNSGYAQLRSLLYNSETDVTFVFVSRRMVSELDKQLDESNLSGTLGTPIYVTPYNEDELDQYFTIAKEAGYDMDHKREALIQKIGAYPHWLDLFMYRLVDEDNNMAIDDVFNHYAGTFYDEFDHLNAILDDQELLHPLMQLIFGPVFDCTISQLKSLEDYGMIQYDANSEVEALAKAYETYLQSKRKDIDFAPKWRECERLLRDMLKNHYHELYGDNWEETIIHMYDYGDFKSMIKDALANQKDIMTDHVHYASGIYVDVLDTASTGMLFALYSVLEEPFYNDKLKIRKRDFMDMTKHLRLVRNKFAHNNEEILKLEVRQQSSSYVDQIVDHINQYFNRIQ